MAFCRYCGQQLPENANACPYCGKFVKEQNTPQTPPQQDTQQAAPQQEVQQTAPQQEVQQTPPQDAQQIPPQQSYQNYQPNPQQGYQNYQQTPPQQGYQQPYQQAPEQGYGAPAQAYITPDMDVMKNKGIAWFSYLGLLFLIPLFARKDSEYTRFHVKQGVTLCAVELAFSIVRAIFMAIIDAIFPGQITYAYGYYRPTVYVHSEVYRVFSVLFGLAGIFFFVLMIIGIVNAATGKRKELPLIGKIPWVANLLDKTVYKK